MEINFNWNSDTLILIGASGCGKTTFALEFARGCPRIIALDSNFEWASKLHLKPVKDPSLIVPNSALQTISYNYDTINRFIIATRKYTNCLVIYEDVDLFIQNSPPEEVRNFQINGRHQGLGQIVVSKRLIGLPLLLLQKADFLRIWKMSPLLARKDIAVYRPVIPTIDRHMNLSKHSAITYMMDADVAKPIHLYNCNCVKCKLGAPKK